MSDPDPMSNDPTPPMLFDIVTPGEQARSRGIRLGEPDSGAPPRPGAGDGSPAPEDTAAQRTPDPATLTELRRDAARELARRFRTELDRELPEAIRDARRRIRRAVDDAMVSAVKNWHQETPDTERND